MANLKSASFKCAFLHKLSSVAKISFLPLVCVGDARINSCGDHAAAPGEPEAQLRARARGTRGD